MASTPRSGTAVGFGGPAELAISLPSPVRDGRAAAAVPPSPGALNAGGGAGVSVVSKSDVALGAGQASAPEDVTLKLGSGGGGFSATAGLAAAEGVLASVEATEPTIKKLVCTVWYSAYVFVWMGFGQ